MKMSRNQQKQPLVSDNPSAFPNGRNKNGHMISGECGKLCQSTDSDPVTLVESEVVRCFSRVNPNEVPGPDGMRGRVLKVCFFFLTSLVLFSLAVFSGSSIFISCRVLKKCLLLCRSS